ncbi:MAG: hypothetical protein AAF763_15635 [Pseudomonadota bacterium]
MTIRELLAAAACAALLASPAAAVTQQLISVDFGSADTTVGAKVASFSGVENAAAAADDAFSGADVWNSVNFEFSAATQDYEFSSLTDSTGVDTSVGLRFGLEARAWEFDQTGSGGEPLRDSFLFVGGESTRPVTLDFEVFGVDAGAAYALFFYGAESNADNHSGFVTLDEDGDADLADETGRLLENDFVSPTDVFFEMVKAGADGRILGRFDVRDIDGDPIDELNVAGLQIARLQTIPLPAGAALLPAAFGLAWGVRRRRR